MTKPSLKDAAARFTAKRKTTPDVPSYALTELEAAHAARQGVADKLEPLYLRRNQVAEALRQRLDAADQRADSVAGMPRRPSDPNVNPETLTMSCRASERAKIRNEVAEAEGIIADLDGQIEPLFARYESANAAFAEARSRVLGGLTAAILDRVCELEHLAASLMAVAHALDGSFFNGRDPIAGGITNRAMAATIVQRTGLMAMAAAISADWRTRIPGLAQDPSNVPTLEEIERLFARNPANSEAA